ncbi:MAG: alpha-ketoglutarate-dependent dioxygenase AlkB family protein [Flavobacteriales bacterium]
MFSDYEHLAHQALQIQDGKLDYFPGFLLEKERIALKNEILNELLFEQITIKLFGKQIAAPRLEAYFSLNGENYGYSGQQLKNQPFPTFLNELRQKVEAKTGCKYNALLVNLYRDGQDSNGWHADNEKSLGSNPSIASLSLGVARFFELKHIGTGRKIKLLLEDGSLLHMHGELQHYWKHQLPKVRNITDLRINLTFRKIVASN